jgi:hypothetical protein
MEGLVMRQIGALGSIAFFTIAALLAGCSGHSGPVPPAAAPDQSGAFSVTASSYHPTFTVYHFPFSEPEPFAGPLAVNSAGTQFYFSHVRLKNGTWTESYLPSYTYKSQQIGGGLLWAFDLHNVLYNIATGPGSDPGTSSIYFVSHADASTGYVVTPLPGDADGYDLESDSMGRVFDLGTNTIYIIVNPSSAAPALHHVTLPSSSTAFPCPYRLTEGTDQNIYVSTCIDYKHIYRYSRYFTLLATGYDSSASHINEIAPDPNGGVWYADDKGNHFGKMSTTGKIAKFALPSNVRLTAVATAHDGTVWASEYNSVTQAVYIAHVSETGALTLYPMPKGVMPAVFMRGTYLSAATISSIYWLDANGDVVIVRSI